MTISSLRRWCRNSVLSVLFVGCPTKYIGILLLLFLHVWAQHIVWSSMYVSSQRGKGFSEQKGSLQLPRWTSFTAQDQASCPGHEQANCNIPPASTPRYCYLLNEAKVTDTPLFFTNALMLKLHNQCWRCCLLLFLCPWQQSGWTTFDQAYSVLFV